PPAALGGADRIRQRATGMLPVEPIAFSYLADAAERRGHLDLARRALVDYHALAGESFDPRRAAALAIRIGDLSLRSNRAASAVAWYQRGLGSDPGTPALLRLAE